MNRPRVVCVVQARMTSTRLPGKVLLRLGGRSVLEHVVRRCGLARYVDEVVVAVPDDVASMPIVEHCAALGARAFRGSEHDVLARYASTAKATDASVVVRVTSDCPLIEPVFIDSCVVQVLASAATEWPFDYFSNVDPRRLPRGLDVEVFTAEALERAQAGATLASEREHVTPYLRTRSEFRRGSLSTPGDFSNLRWTLDTPEDFAMLSRLFELGGDDLDFPTALAVGRSDPAIAAINANVAQKAI